MSNQQKNLNFSIYYDANEDDLKNHRLPADRVAKAIDHMSKLISESDKTLNGKNKTADLFVSGSLKQGSLGIDFYVQLCNPENAKLLLQSIGLLTMGIATARGVKNGLDSEDTQITTCSNLFEVSEEIDGATTIDFETVEESDEVNIKINDKTIIAPESVARLIQNPVVRKHIHDLVTKPIKDYKSPIFKIGDNEKTIIELKEQSINKIKKLSITENEQKQRTIKKDITFAQINFDSLKGWKINLDGKKTPIEITDEFFIKRVNKSEQQFKKSDEYQVELIRSITYNEFGKEKIKYTLTKAKKK